MRAITIMSGVAGVGKSTFIVKHAADEDIIISRDAWRENLRRFYGSTDYFPVPAKKETNLWKTHINALLIANPESTIWIDQTTVTQSSLDKLLGSLLIRKEKDNITVISLVSSLEEILARNAQREGITKVPYNTIMSMYQAKEANPIKESSFYNLIEIKSNKEDYWMKTPVGRVGDDS